MTDTEIAKIRAAYPRQVYGLLDTKAAGLSSSEAEKRLKEFGKNQIAKKKAKPTYLVFLSNFVSPMAILLWVAGAISVISAFIGTKTDDSIGPIVDPQTLYLGIAIWLVNIINGLFSFFQEFKAGKATDALAKMLPSYARVIRDGQEVRVKAENVVPGDIMVLAEGDKIPADGRVLICDDLAVTQASLTGEATPVRKNEMPLKEEPDSPVGAKNMVFSGTSVASGNARVAVMNTGMNAEFGKIASLTQNIKDKKSPLHGEIDHTTKIIAIIALAIGLAVLVLGITINGLTEEDGFSNPKLYLTQFIFALGMIVAFIPEGLSPTVTLSLAKAVQRMAKEGALIKSLDSVETLGSTTVICTDKTGTLTKNEMTVKSLYLPGRVLEVTGDGYAPTGEIKEKTGQRMTVQNDAGLKLLLTIGSLCSDAKLLPPEEGSKDRRYTVLGDPTEACLGVVARKGLLEPGNQLNLMPRIRELHFDSERKMMTTIHQLSAPLEGAQRIAYTKGSPKELLDKCSYIFDGLKKRKITKEDIAAAMAQTDRYANEGLRVLAMAYRLLPKGAGIPVALSDYTPANIETDMVFVGLEAMQDPPREEIKAAVNECHRAGIKIIMVTGDYGLTALAIGKKIGIVTSDDTKVITGLELQKMDDRQIREALKGEVIFARMAPEQKYRVVSTLQDLGETVAVTGDGVNDAPALKKADIGVAMGITGTDVAKDAADMILTDDNFASIVKAVKEGRAVFNNIKKFITYIFNSNVPEAIPFLLPLLTFNVVPQPLGIMEVLFIDLGTDMLPALGLGSERPMPNVMDQKPRGKDTHIIDRKLLLKAFGWYGVITTVFALGAFFLYNLFVSESLGIQYTLFDSSTGSTLLGLSSSESKRIWESSTAVVLTSIVFCQMGMALNCRTNKDSLFKVGLFTNRTVWMGIMAEGLMIVAMPFVPFLNEEIFSAYGITVWQCWLLILAMPIAVVAIDEGRKAILRHKDMKDNKGKERTI
mgnify:CR=1 FL=1